MSDTIVSMTARMIRLRRPPTLSMQDQPFVPEKATGDVMTEVDQRWRQLCEQNPAYYDGRLCHVIGVHRNGYGGAVLHVADCAYRFHAVQDEAFDLGVRPLGVKGITLHENRVLLGRRSIHVAAYKHMWEFAPGGVVEPGEDPKKVVQRELTEETGLSATTEPRAMAILYDTVLRCWELVYRVEADDEAVDEKLREYDDVVWCVVNEWPTPLSPIANNMTALVKAVMRSSA